VEFNIDGYILNDIIKYIIINVINYMIIGHLTGIMIETPSCVLKSFYSNLAVTRMFTRKSGIISIKLRIDQNV